MITVYLVWTLLNGQPVDVNSYMTKDMCESQLVEAKSMLAHAKKQHPNVPDFDLVGCQSIEVMVPRGI